MDDTVPHSFNPVDLAQHKQKKNNNTEDVY